jgi:Protein of unknown function (DUF2442)
MNILVSKIPIALNVWFSNDKMNLLLEDGREISVPLAWFPTLLNANDAQRNNWRLIGNGEGIHWDELDEDILVDALL